MLKLIKKGDKYWLFEDSEIGLFSPSKFTINLLNNVITIVYENGLKSKNYNVIDCEIYDLGATSPFTTSSGNAFMQKLEELNCPCFQKNENIFNISGGAWGDITGTLSDQTDLQNALNSKIDKVSTAGVERAYIINADGSQGTKATSEFKDVLEFADLASFPTTGESGKIYIALDSGFTYSWSGSAYVQIGGAKRVAVCDLGRFQIKVTAVNNFVNNAPFSSFFSPSLATGVSNHLLLCPNSQSVIYKVPFDCSLEEICISTATNFDGNISIWKTAPNSFSSTPIELFYVEDDTYTAYKKFTIDSPKILKDSFIHIFFARRSVISAWWSGGFLRFKEI